jgi:hypothetical protein
MRNLAISQNGWIGKKIKSTKQVVGLPEHLNNNSVFQILLMSSKHRQQETKSGKNLQ